jgi:hypothetical protein
MPVSAEDIEMALAVMEDVQGHLRFERKIMLWEGLRPGQKVAALIINAISYEKSQFPTAPELAEFLGIPIDRAQSIFDGLEHPPYALTKVGTDYERFIPTQTLAYQEEYEGEG